MKINGLTSGCFDLIHFGHVHYLQRCRARCDYLIVGVDCDELVRKVKGSERPIIPEAQRLALIQSLRCVDATFLLKRPEDLHQATVINDIRRVFKHEGFRRVDPIYGVTGTKAELVIVPDVEGIMHTTEILERVRRKT